MTNDEILDYEWEFSDCEAYSIRQYLKQLLHALWNEGEAFSGKRPFGNSGWECDLYAPLIKMDVVDGELDEDGYVNDVDDRKANGIIFNLIEHIFKGK